MDLAGNPFGTYVQDEPCIHCGAALVAPGERTLRQKVLSRMAFYARSVHTPFMRRRPNWIHVLFQRRTATRRIGIALPRPAYGPSNRQIKL
jgi:hypothetical protein